jgi:hypothetical protein
MGYVAFILISLTHVHTEEHYSNSPVQVANNTLHSGANSQTEETCQVCQLFSSININTNSLIITGSLTPECLISPDNETTHQFTTVNVNCLRGPPVV